MNNELKKSLKTIKKLNLDTENSIMIANILFKYVKEEGSSLIMVTHDPKLADKAKRKIKIKDGKIK